MSKHERPTQLTWQEEWPKNYLIDVAAFEAIDKAIREHNERKQLKAKEA